MYVVVVAYFVLSQLYIACPLKHIHAVVGNEGRGRISYVKRMI